MGFAVGPPSGVSCCLISGPRFLQNRIVAAGYGMLGVTGMGTVGFGMQDGNVMRTELFMSYLLAQSPMVYRLTIFVVCVAVLILNTCSR